MAGCGEFFFFLSLKNQGVKTTWQSHLDFLEYPHSQTVRTDCVDRTDDISNQVLPTMSPYRAHLTVTHVTVCHDGYIRPCILDGIFIPHTLLGCCNFTHNNNNNGNKGGKKENSGSHLKTGQEKQGDKMKQIEKMRKRKK